MFDQISPTYDRVNRILSFGQDLQWRNKVASHLPDRPNLSLLDLASGTGDQLLSLFESGRSIERAIGIDIAEKMLEIARAKLKVKPYRDKVLLQTADALALPFAENSFDAASFSFGIRNVSHPAKSIEEIYRVLKPKGRVLILEFSLPKQPFRALYLTYLRYILPTLGGMLSKQPSAYRYLNKTIESFPSGDAFLALLKAAGFRESRAHPMAGGAVTLYIGEKP